MKGKTSRHLVIVYILLCLVLASQIVLSIQMRPLRAAWANVPPVPSELGLKSMALGDPQFSYRLTGVMLQNLGNTGGRSVALSEYDYGRLGEWFTAADKLDPVSDYVPLLAAYYFGATQDVKDLTPVIDYLAMVGQRSEGEKWRWLAQAVYLARFKQNDLNRALELAILQASLWREGRPGWMRQMPTFIMAAQGDKASAYDLMLRIIREDGDKMHPNEVNFMVSYICERILNPVQAGADPLCQSGEASR